MPVAEDMDFESFDNLDDMDWSELEADLTQEEKQAKQKTAKQAKKAQAGAGRAGTGGGSQVEIGYLLDVSLEVSVEVGKTTTYISNILEWDRGSIIELEKLVGESLNIMINQKPVAKGEVVVVNEKFAVKIIEILDPKDRLNFLDM